MVIKLNSMLLTHNLTAGGGVPSVPSGFSLVARVREGSIQYATSPSNNNGYAVHRSA